MGPHLQHHDAGTLVGDFPLLAHMLFNLVVQDNAEQGKRRENHTDEEEQRDEDKCVDDPGSRQREQIDEEGRIVFGGQTAAPPDDTAQIKEHEQDHGRHQQGMPGTADILVIGCNVVQESRALGDSQQDKVRDPKYEGSTEQYAPLPSFSASVQQERCEHGYLQGEEEIFKIDGNSFCCRHVRFFPYQAINEKGRHAQHKRCKKACEEAPVPSVCARHDGSNHQSQRG